MLLQQSLHGESSPEAPTAQAGGTHSLLPSPRGGLHVKQIIDFARSFQCSKLTRKNRADFHLRVVTSYCLVIKITEILQKMTASWPCDCFIQKQTNSKASGVRF
jgi:hypothetical protein